MGSDAHARSLRGDKAFYLFAALLVGVTTSIIALSSFGMQTLSEVRAYVAGEGRWSKGQKDAVYKLRRYIGSGDERDYQQFHFSLALPLGDHRARLEMNKPAFDYEVAREGLVAGGNDPADVPGMIQLYRSFSHMEPLVRTIRFWEGGDVEILSLQAAGDRVHRAILSGSADASELAATLQEIDDINARATQFEVGFSQSLGEAARWLSTLLLGLTVFVALLLVALALWLSRGLLRRLRRGEEAVRKSELVYKSLVEQSPFGIASTVGDGRIVSANPALVAILGYASERELTEKDTLRDIYLEAGARTRAIDAVPRQGHATVENFWRRKDGSVISVRQTSRAVFDSRCEPEQYVTIVEDITERRDLESQLRQSQKMEAIGQLASGVAHDFNNLLAAIMGSAEILLEELPAGSSRDDVGEIRSAALRAAGLTRQLLAFGRKQALAPRLINLNELIAGTETLLRRTLGEDIDLRTVLAPGLGAARADPGQLEQVIVNLAVNARDAMADGGKLTIETANVDLDAAYVGRHTVAQPGRYVMFAVSDTGSGMDAKVMARLFEPFFTTKPRDKRIRGRVDRAPRRTGARRGFLAKAFHLRRAGTEGARAARALNMFDVTRAHRASHAASSAPAPSPARPRAS
jgi:PAS domain S-box-containing protein